VAPTIPVHLVPYDPAWPAIAAHHMTQLRAMEGLFVATHHIGSTSVPGLTAKPVVDLIGIVSDLALLETRRTDMEALGYVWHGAFGVEDRRFFTWDDPETGQRVINLHCYETHSPNAALQLAFRNYLRAFPDVAADYAQEKQRAMRLFPDNSTLYAEEKGPFIRATLEKAKAWVGETQPG
jgi:GrpB-like predicted nucleotidyltransferase (UPF0157 family)